MSPEEIARAFSSHQFEEVYPHLADEVRWVSAGQSTVHGKAAVIEACQGSLAELSEVTTQFSRFVVIAGNGEAAAVDAIGEYTDAGGDRSVVSSCDVYEFAGGQLTTITSYAVELPSGADA